MEAMQKAGMSPMAVLVASTRGGAAAMGRLADFGTFILNPWAIAAYAHTMVAAVVTGSFVVAAVGAFYALQGCHADMASRFLKTGVIAGLISSFLVAFPTGDHHAKLVARVQPVALAAMEGRFESGSRAGITLIGQPNVAERRLDNPIVVPGVLSFLAFGTFQRRSGAGSSRGHAPDNIELLYYAFHVMAGLGTMPDRAGDAVVLAIRAGWSRRVRSSGADAAFLSRTSRRRPDDGRAGGQPWLILWLIIPPR
jgi:cytochrome bd-type quinol oxidase subunit 1